MKSCPDCNKKILFSSKRCRSCATKNQLKNKENHPNWKGGKPKCLDCNKEVSSRKHKRCFECSLKHRAGSENGMFGKESAFKGKKHTLETRIIQSQSNRRENHHNWKGGISPLHIWIRRLPESTNWKTSVFIRDNRTCKTCGYNENNIEANHIKPFSIILKEFLDKYNMFSPIEDKEILLRLASGYEEFWDINNGETLCESCHKQVTKKQFEERVI